MTPLSIPLHFRAEDFETIYFKDDHHLILKNRSTRYQVLLTVLVGIIWLTVGIKLLAYGGSTPVFAVICILFAITSARLKKRIDPILRWKKEINLFIKNLEQAGNRTLILSDDSFQYKDDERETTERWNEVKSAEVTTDYISINAAEADYLFPRKSMTEQEFEQLRSVISEKGL